jgi:phage shock protein PspC (stress-responsive transcriptional regulator)
MNKTVTINISGIIFHIEEDAFESLSKYLADIKSYFSNTEGGNEIMSDIESRIAELLQERTSASKQVVLMSDVEVVKNVMGKPEDFGGEHTKKETENRNNGYNNEYQQKTKRKLFRDPDDKAIGGVCSGLAAYFDVDTVWIRLAMFLLIFFGGLSLWVYIILWMVIPQAKTTADKFAMRGEPANINNIYQSFKEEAEDVKNRFNKNKDSYRQQFKDTGRTVKNNGSIFLHGLFNLIGRAIGLFLLILGCVLLFTYVLSVFGISFADSNIHASHWKSVIFESTSNYVLGVIAFIIVFGIPVFMLVYAGIKLLFRLSYSNKWLNLSLGMLWLLGLIIGIYVTASTLMQFSENTKLKEVVELKSLGDTIVVKLNPVYNTLKQLNVEKDGDLDTELNNQHGGYHFAETSNGLSIIGFAGLDVIESSNDSVEMVIYQSAKGKTKKEANANAKAISYTYQQSGNQLIFDEVFSVAAGTKFRVQEVDLKLKLPKGKVIYFDKSVKHLLDDVENTTNTWDGDMVARRWKMTEKGLECIDCNNLDNLKNDEDETDEKKKNITINNEGIKVNGDEAEIKIDGNGVRIKTKDKDEEEKN